MPGKPRGHVNLMIDTVIANLEIQDLRAIVRHLIATNPANVSAFCAATQNRLLSDARKSKPPDSRGDLREGEAPHELFAVSRVASRNEVGCAHQQDILGTAMNVIPTATLHRVLARARCYFGSGLAVASLPILEDVIQSVSSLAEHGAYRGFSNGVEPATNSQCGGTPTSLKSPLQHIQHAFAIIDADISQAIQACTEQIERAETVPSNSNANARSVGVLTCPVESSASGTEPASNGPSGWCITKEDACVGSSTSDDDHIDINGATPPGQRAHTSPDARKALSSIHVALLHCRKTFEEAGNTIKAKPSLSTTFPFPLHFPFERGLMSVESAKEAMLSDGDT